MNWRKDQYVTHDKKPQWGVGKIVDSNSQDFTVFFADSGRRTFMQLDAPISVVSADTPVTALFDHLAPSVLEGTERFHPLSECVERFKKIFPEGFYDAAYLASDVAVGERQYKLAASELAKELLAEAEWRRLSDAGQFEEICLRLGRVESKTNLLHTFEKIKWQSALRDKRLQRPLAEAIFGDLYGVGDRRDRFEALKKVLGEAEGCAKWTVATYYGFLLLPHSRIFIKPEVTKFAALACGWDIQYNSDLNWITLSNAEKLAGYLAEELTRRGMPPRDMIDVQSFIWCIEPKSYA